MLGRLLVRRVAFAVVQLLGASIVIFAVVRLMPGDPAVAILGANAGPDQVEALQERLGLNRSVLEQYAIWLGDVLHGDLGRSWVTSNAVTDDIKQRLPATLELITVSLAIAVLVLIPLGVLTARKSARILSRLAERGTFTYGMLAGSMPDFWLALILIFVFYVNLGWAPAPLGRLDIAMTPPREMTGSYLIDSAIAGEWAVFWSAMRHLALPVATLVFVYGAPILKMTQQTVAKMLDSEFVELGRSAGVSATTEMRIAFKNALPPILTIAAVTYGYVLGGAVLVETIFSWGGLGQYAVQSIINADFSAIQGFVLVATAFSIVVFLVMDVVHYMIDPRVLR